MDIDLLTFENILRKIEQENQDNKQSEYYSHDYNKKQKQKIDKTDKNEKNEYENQYLESDKRTLVINNLPLDLDRQTLYDILKENGAKNIEEIRFLKNQKTREFSGRAFVQFYKEKHAVEMLKMNNAKVQGFAINVILASEKRKKDEYKQKRQYNDSHRYDKHHNKGILVRNLAGPLKNLQEGDIKDLFYPFGDIQFVDITYDPNKQQNDGYAVIIYYESKDASIAIQKMNGYLVNSIPLMVSILPEDISLFYNNLKYQGYQDLESNQEIKYIHKKLKGLCNEQIDDENLVEENNVKHLKYQLQRHKHFSKEPKKVLGIYNLWGVLTDQIKDQKKFLRDLKIDVVQKSEQYGTVRESYVDFQFRGIVVKMGSKQTTQKMYKDFNDQHEENLENIISKLKKKFNKTSQNSSVTNQNQKNDFQEENEMLKQHNRQLSLYILEMTKDDRGQDQQEKIKKDNLLLLKVNQDLRILIKQLQQQIQSQNDKKKLEKNQTRKKTSYKSSVQSVQNSVLHGTINEMKQQIQSLKEENQKLLKIFNKNKLQQENQQTQKINDQELDLQDLQENIKVLQYELDGKDKTIEKLTKKLKDQKNDNKQESEKMKEYIEEMKVYENQKEEWNCERQIFQDKIEKQQKKIEQIKKQVLSLQNVIKNLSEDNDSQISQQKIQFLGLKQVQKEDKNDNFSKKAQNEIQKLQKTVDQLSDENQQKQKQIEKLLKELKNEQEQYQNIKIEIQKKEEVIKEINFELKEVKDKLEFLNYETDNTQKNPLNYDIRLNQNSRVKFLEQVIEKKDTEIQTLYNKNSELQNSKKKLQTQQQILENKYNQELEIQKTRVNSDINALHNQLEYYQKQCSNLKLQEQKYKDQIQYLQQVQIRSTQSKSPIKTRRISLNNYKSFLDLNNYIDNKIEQKNEYIQKINDDPSQNIIVQNFEYYKQENGQLKNQINYLINGSKNQYKQFYQINFFCANKKYKKSI